MVRKQILVALGAIRHYEQGRPLPHGFPVRQWLHLLNLRSHSNVHLQEGRQEEEACARCQARDQEGPVICKESVRLMIINKAVKLKRLRSVDVLHEERVACIRGLGRLLEGASALRLWLFP